MCQSVRQKLRGAIRPDKLIHMPKSKLILTSLLHAAGVAAYIFLVALLMQNAEIIVGKMDNYFSPVAFLLLFVLSAAITGSLTLGRSILWYIDGRKKEALQLFFYILGWLFLFMLLIFAVQFAVRKIYLINSATFNCAENKIINADFYKNKVNIEINDGRSRSLPQTISASGARYANADESFVFWNKGDTAFVEENGTSTIHDCITGSKN
jgi:membrane-bound inhibitor of C-type lysozyme